MADVKTKDLARELVKDAEILDLGRLLVKDMDIAFKIMPYTIARLVAEGKSVEINDLVEFSVTTVKEHAGRNPQTGETITIPEKKRPVCKPRKYFKGVISGEIEQLREEMMTY